MTTFTDKRGLAVTVANQAAADALDDLVDAYIGFRADSAQKLKAAMTADALGRADAAAAARDSAARALAA